MYLKCFQSLIKKFKEVSLEQIPKGKNGNADALTKWGSQRKVTLLGVIPLEIQDKHSVPINEVMQIDGPLVETWMTPI